VTEFIRRKSNEALSISIEPTLLEQKQSAENWELMSFIGEFLSKIIKFKFKALLK
jgi:hypothetical protein